MSFIAEDFLAVCDDDLKHPPSKPLDVLPPSMRDVDMAEPQEMFQPMSEACPNCGGFCMWLGDYVCWGICHHCFDAATEAS